ncbi:hypothetical protein COL154_013423 [Colletotrichum chrysophilum]|nr:hypothetical protein KNSL1_013359 [Colletotrichum chrysophilum]KAJ0350001.1 hypothetical protein COL154_013423 [Colletotrichum chrysophilum]
MQGRDSNKNMRAWSLGSRNHEVQPSMFRNETVQNEPDVEYHVDSEEECLSNQRKRKRDSKHDASDGKRHKNRAKPAQVPVKHRPQAMNDDDLPSLVASVMDLLHGKVDAGGDGTAGRGPITRSRASKQPRELTTPQRHNTPAVPTMETFDDRAEYPVEALLAKAKIGRRVYYKVKWEGYDTSQSSWVKMKDIGDEAIEAFKMGGKRGVFTFDKIIAAAEGAAKNASYLIQLRLGDQTDTAKVDASDLSAAEIARFRLHGASEEL